MKNFNLSMAILSILFSAGALAQTSQHAGDVVVTFPEVNPPPQKPMGSIMVTGNGNEYEPKSYEVCSYKVDSKSQSPIIASANCVAAKLNTQVQVVPGPYLARYNQTFSWVKVANATSSVVVSLTRVTVPKGNEVHADHFRVVLDLDDPYQKQEYFRKWILEDWQSKHTSFLLTYSSINPNDGLGDRNAELMVQAAAAAIRKNDYLKYASLAITTSPRQIHYNAYPSMEGWGDNDGKPSYVKVDPSWDPRALNFPSISVARLGDFVSVLPGVYVVQRVKKIAYPHPEYWEVEGDAKFGVEVGYQSKQSVVSF